MLHPGLFLHSGVVAGTHSRKEDWQDDPLLNEAGAEEMRLRRSSIEFLQNAGFNITLIGTGTGLRFIMLALVVKDVFPNARMVYSDELGTDTSSITIHDSTRHHDWVFVRGKYKIPARNYIPRKKHFTKQQMWEGVVKKIHCMRRRKQPRGMTFLSTGRELLQALGYKGLTSNRFFELNIEAQKVIDISDGKELLKSNLAYDL